MIGNLTVENYRSFQNYSLNGLKRVNLLTGYNNSGKSSLLEAVQLLASAGEVIHLVAISERRDEHNYGEQPGSGGSANLTHLFPDHDIQNKIAIRSDRWSVGIEYKLDNRDNTYSIVVTRDGENSGSSVVDYRTGSVNLSDRIRRYDPFCPVEYVGTQGFRKERLAYLWNQILMTTAENGPVESLRLLDDQIESVVYLSSGSNQGRLYVGKKGETKRSPIGSWGEGMQRLLMLAIALETTRGGILLVDEIDTGLHYSVLADMWKLVIATAIKNDIQVFATTHSLDCLRGLNEACERNPEFASEVSTQTIDRNLDSSIAGDANDLRAALDLGIEVR